MPRLSLSIAFIFLCTAALISCGPQTPTAQQPGAAPSPVSPLDASINDYEKTVTAFVHAAKKLRAGDVSVTMPFIDLGDQIRKEAAKLQTQAAAMTPAQAQRVAAISAKAAPFVQK